MPVLLLNEGERHAMRERVPSMDKLDELATQMNQSDDVQLLADQALAALYSALRSGELRDGQLLSMSQLVDIIDKPISAIREAVKQASAHGLLVTLPKRGIRIMEAHPDTIRDCLDFRMMFDQEGARRRISEGRLCGLQSLREQHQEMRDLARTDTAKCMATQPIEVDLSLHDYLAAGLQNPQMEAAYSANRMRIAIIQNARPFLLDRVASAMDEHLRIISALEGRDIDSAVEAIRYHCAQTLRWWGVYRPG